MSAIKKTASPSP